VGGEVLLEDEGLVVVEGGEVLVVEALVVLVGRVLRGEGGTEMAASIWCSMRKAPCRSRHWKASSSTQSFNCWMFFTADFSSAFTSPQGGASTGSRLKVRRPSEEDASFGLERAYLGRREGFIQY
jgi:hypothetical protein